MIYFNNYLNEEYKNVSYPFDWVCSLSLQADSSIRYILEIYSRFFKHFEIMLGIDWWFTLDNKESYMTSIIC